MAFTYTGDPNVSNRDKIRFLIGDTVQAEAHFQDEEITYLISEWGNAYDAARAAAEILAGRYAHKAQSSKSVGDLSISESFSAAAAEFRQLALDIDAQAKRKQGSSNPLARVNAQAIKSTADRTVTTHTTDFYAGLHDKTY